MPHIGQGIENWPPSIAAQLLARSVDLACTVGFDGRIREATGRWQALLGWDPSELSGCPLSKLMPDGGAAAPPA